MVERILGVDLGISSLGWAVVEYDQENPAANRILDCGVRLFTAAETPKEKESPNKARRQARGTRRVLSRRRVRMNAIKKLLLSNGVITEADLDEEDGIFYSKAKRADVWKLRHDALHRLLRNDELARVLIHIAKHRGYKFIWDDETDEESGKVKKAGAALRQNFEMAKCRTVGEWLWRERGANGKKRNKQGDYELSIHRDLLDEEIDAIFLAQQAMGSTIATDALKSSYKEIAFFVRPMQGIENMVGYCTYFPEEKRAPKCSPTAEKFIAIGKFLSTVVINHEGREQKIIERKSISELLDFAFSSEKITFGDLRKFLCLNETEIFKGLHYRGKPKKAKKRETSILDAPEPTEWVFDKAEAEKRVWISLKGAAKLREALGEELYQRFLALGENAEEAVKILTYYKDERQKRRELEQLSLETDMVDKLVNISFSNFLKLSLRAIRAILPAMENGTRYDEAVLMLGKPYTEKSQFLPPLDQTNIDILNPTVIRAFAQFRKVANALVRKYGSFDKVHFELAREINTKGEIKTIKESQLINEKERQEAADWIAEKGFQVPLTRKNILKKRLYVQQDGRCVYTGEVIELERLFEEGYCEIDHILPRSRSADDSFANKVLCLAKANQEKANKTPYEWFGADEARWSAFETRISTPSNRARMGKGKIDRLLKKNFDENSETAFKDRNLNDTRYMARAIKNYCDQYWVFNNPHIKTPVQVRSGKLTSTLRHLWGLDSKDRENHTHHAVDAIIIAFSTQGMVQKLSEYYHLKETRYEKERPQLATPMANFRDAVEEATRLERTEMVKDGVEIKRLLISRPPRAKVTGAAHEETIHSPKKFKGRGVLVNNGKGVCANGDMPRVDVFRKDGKYYLVPIYVADLVRRELPNRAIVAGKTWDDWDVVDESFEFLFSLRKDDLIAIKVKKKEEIFGYFGGVHSSTAGITVRLIDLNKEISGIGSKRAEYIKKYQIDPLGYYHEVKQEKRLGTIPQMRSVKKSLKK